MDETTKPGFATRIASRAVFLYLRFFPLKRGKDRLWRSAAAVFLVSELENGSWLRTSGLTEAEKALFLKEGKEPRTVDFLIRFLEPGMISIDVGANIGYLTVVMAARTGPVGRVHAFEPTPALAQRIRLNCRLSGLANVQVNQLAVSDTSGTATLRLSREDHEANSLFDVEMGSDTISVATTTLSDYVAGLSDDRIDFIKLDCEGSELNALKGSIGLLNRVNGPVILFECNPETLQTCGASVADLVGYLHSAEYRCYTLEQLRAGPQPVWNILAVKKSHGRAAQLIAEHGLEKFNGLPIA